MMSSANSGYCDQFRPVAEDVSSVADRGDIGEALSEVRDRE